MLAKLSISVASNHTRSPAAVSASAICCGRSPSFQAWLRKMSYSADTRSGSNAKRELRKAYTKDVHSRSRDRAGGGTPDSSRAEGVLHPSLEQILSWCIRVEHRFSGAFESCL